MRRLTALLAGALLLVAASPAVEDANPWLGRRVLDIAHQGGRLEAPSNTLYAFARAVEEGADVIELDVHATADRELVVIHDTTVDRTTDGSGRVDAMTLDELKALDAAYWFSAGCGACGKLPEDDEDGWEFRGVATGDVPPPEGSTANDFTIPTLGEVLARFPDTLVNIEIKRTAPDTVPYEDLVADLLAAHGRTDDVIVVAFSDLAIEKFKLHAPDVHTATATAETAAFTVSAEGPLPGAPNPRYVAVQVPITFEGVPVVTEDFVRDAHANGLAVHVWTINDPEVMRWLVEIGVDGIMTDVPTVLEGVLGRMHVKWNPNARGQGRGR